MTNYKLPNGYSFLQSMVQMYKRVKDPLGTIEDSMKRFGGTYTINVGVKKLMITQDPAFIDYVLRANHKNYYKSPILTEQLVKFFGNGLLISNGEYWLKQRRLIQPGFHNSKIEALYEIMKTSIDRIVEKFPTGDCVDVYPLLNSLAFEVVINSLFNIEVPASSRNELRQFIDKTQELVLKEIRQPYKSWWFKLSGEVKRNLKNSRAARSMILSIIQERKKTKHKINDLLDMLLDSRYEDTNEPMSEEQIIDEILILIVAGHETTANVLSWTLYLLANHPLELERLKQQTKDLTLKETVQHDLLAAVIKEVMRLYPPAWVSDRIPIQDDSYGPYTFPKDIIILLYYFGAHRNEKYWQDPTAFKPDRFLKANTDKEKPKSYFPFGGGPRLCIGNNFAMAEMAIFLQAMVQQFHISSSGQIPTVNPLITLRPDRVIIKIAKV